MATKWRVDIIESEAGWGQKVDEEKFFDDPKEAEDFVKKYNSANKPGPAPSYYMRADRPVKVEVPDKPKKKRKKKSSRLAKVVAMRRRAFAYLNVADIAEKILKTKKPQEFPVGQRSILENEAFKGLVDATDHLARCLIAQAMSKSSKWTKDAFKANYDLLIHLYAATSKSGDKKRLHNSYDMIFKIYEICQGEKFNRYAEEE